ncbi:oxidoreductase [Ensifer sp. NPDC090286]|uniref:oxidoreductase n=1 Tax=Ensifer sp. NPDC090286 TaxID=3363991 RepID=UPI00383A17B5
MIDLHGKTILVAGAAGQLGKVLSQALLNSGANVILNDVSDTSLMRLAAEVGAAERLLTAAGTITDADFVYSVLQSASAHFGKVDGAVNCAYPRNPRYGRKFFDVAYNDFTDNVGSHLGGYFVCMQQCAKYAIERGEPFSLVSMSSIYGVMAPRFEVYDGTAMTMPVEYAAIKSAVQHLTAYVTKYTTGSLFRANCVSPGGIFAHQDERFVERYKSFTRGKGMLDADDITGAVLFLLSDAAQYICGQNIVVDDGFSC